MADFTSVKVGDLGSAAFSGTDLIPHEVGGILKKGSLADLATFIGANASVGFRPVTLTSGQTLPTTTQKEFILVPAGTYTNVNGGATLTVTGELNAIVSNGSYWFVGVEIQIESSGVWGSITGTLSSQTDLQTALNAKEATIIAGTTSQYWRGDKTWQTLDKTAVGLANVDNTSDANKPISSATQTALDATVKLTGDQTIAGTKVFSNTQWINSETLFKQNTSFGFNPGYTTIAGITNGLFIKANTGSSATLNLGSLTSTRTYTLPNTDGTFALTSDLTNKISGSLTNGYLPKATGSTTLGNSLIYDSGTNIGLGTTSPIAPLHIKISSANQLLLDNNGEQYTSQYFANNGTTKGIVLWDNTSTLFKVGTFSANDLTLVTNFTERVRVTSIGNVGIGTTSPSGKLSIVDGYYNTFFADNSSQYGSGLILSGDGGSDQRSWKQFVKNASGGVALTFEVSTSGVSYGSSPTGLTYSEKMRITPSGNVGIGTTAPTSKLHVVGLPAYADNTTALAGGLTVGAFYHTAGVLKVVI